VDAAQEQLAAIRKLGADRGLSLLPDRLRETAEKRLEFPESDAFGARPPRRPAVTKSCLRSNRLKRLMSLAGQSDT
jgi:DNA-binding transcriptional regulator WhiA